MKIVSVWGKSFIHPAFDVLLIGGGLSLIFTLVLAFGPSEWNQASLAAIPMCAVFLNATHFCASYLRLYWKPGAKQTYRNLSDFGPLVFFVATSLVVVLSAHLGRHVQALYLSWSPYHYAAQTFGLCMIYLYRSGKTLPPRSRQMIKWSAFVPFFWAILQGRHYGAGLGWFAAPHDFANLGVWNTALDWLQNGLLFTAFAAPAIVMVRHWWLSRSILPLMVPLLLVSNAVWWITLNYLHAFAWVTSFHAIQYLAILLVFHASEQKSLHPERPAWRSVLAFYAASVAAGYALFRGWGYAFEAMGFGYAESSALVIASLNIYHFIVDAFLWKLKNDSNEKTLQASPLGQAA